MANFSHLKELELTTDKTVEYVLHQITVNGKTPTLHVAPATEANKQYFNTLIKRMGKSSRAARAGQMSVGMLEDNRAEDQELYAKHVVKSWDDMLDSDGSVVKFSKSDCQDFLTQLPGWIFDDLRLFCGNPSNFVEVLDVEATAKN